MSDGYLMGLDIGGGGIRCLIVDVASGTCTAAFAPWHAQPVPGVPMGAEYDPAATWHKLAEVARRARAQAGARPDQILGIAATSMRHGSALLDADGAALLLAPNHDARGSLAALQLVARGAEIHQRTGHWPNAVQAASRLRWLADNDPGTLARATTHMALSDWIAFRLCGERATEASQASETLLLEIAEPQWARDQIAALDLSPDLFPALRASGAPLGRLTDAAADALDLRAGTPVAVGGADTQCGMLGAGVLTPGDVAIVAGTSVPVLQVHDHPVLDADGRLWAVHHVVPGRWALESNGGALGDSLEWLAALLFPETDHPVLHLFDEAARAPAGSGGLVSTFGADVMDARSMMLPVGNVTLNHMTVGDGQRAHFCRAVLEGTAFAVRANVAQATEAAGTPPGRIRVTGGVSRSPLYTAMLADALESPVEVSAVSESSALGAALCAGVGAGVFDDLPTAADALVRLARTDTPGADADWAQERYPEWRAMREAQRAGDGRASGFAIGALLGSFGSTEDAVAGFRPRILVTADMDDDALAALREIGDVEHASYRTAMRLLTGPALVDALDGVHVFITEVDVVDAASLLKAKDLRAIGVCRGDAVNVDLEAATALGIPVFNTPGRNADAVADLALAFMLALARKLPAANAFLREPGGQAGDMGRMGRAFGTLRGAELWRKTVGLVGLGAVGRKVVERLRPFGARCLVYDPYQTPDALRLAGAEPVSLSELLAASDFVSLHAAVTDASRGLLDAKALAQMKPGAFVINTARAALVDEDALLAALENGQLGGAALDVFAIEPPAWDQALLQRDDVIATPHVGGNTHEVAAHQGRIVASELRRLVAGDAPRHALNPETLSGFALGRQRPAPDPALAERLGNSAGPAVTDLQKEKQRPAKTTTSKTAPAPAAGQTGGPVGEIQATMQKILDRFIADTVADPALAEYARSADDVVLHFALTDLTCEFHLGFRDGAVLGATTPPADQENLVQLSMRADLLDGMLTGRSNAMQAAMNGELSFSGDTAKAMTLQQITRDLSRLYGAARDAVGDPGDLTSLPAPGEATGVPAATVRSDDVRIELCRIVDELYTAQLITATGGNVSARCTDDPEQAWITPSQLFKGDLAPEILVRIGMDGKAIEKGQRSPSSEALMHTAVLLAKSEAQAVIHCHAPNATVLANTGLPFLPISTEAAFFVGIGRIPFVMPGTQELADAIVAAMGDGWAVLMQNHGLLVAGRTLRRAADMAEIIERTAEVILGCHAVGIPPPVLPDDVVEMLSKYGDLMA